MLALGSGLLAGCAAATVGGDAASTDDARDEALAEAAACTCCPTGSCCFASQPPAGTQCPTMPPGPGQPPGQGPILVATPGMSWCTNGCAIAGPLPPPELATL